MELAELTNLKEFIEKNNEENRLDERNREGLKKRLHDIYSDSAHFLYELIQNADDVNASDIEFELHENYLIFIHNGKRKFSIDDCSALVHIGDSIKEDEPNKIGKFGVGFKSVYQYVDEVYICEGHLNIRLYDLIHLEQIESIDDIPYEIRSDFTDKTLFILPLKNSETDYPEILEKLNNLYYPILFTRNVKNITARLPNKTLSYTLHLLNKDTYSKNITTNWSFVKYEKTVNNQIIEQHFFWRFLIESKLAEAKRNELGIIYESDEKGKKLKPFQGKYKLFCFFNLELSLAIDFIVHAPFRTPCGRNDIISDEFNQALLNEFNELILSSISILKEQKAYGNEIFQLFSVITQSIQPIQIKPNLKLNLKDAITNFFSSAQIIPYKTSEYEYAKKLFYISNSDIKKLFENTPLDNFVDSSLNQFLFTPEDKIPQHFLDKIGIRRFEEKDLSQKITSNYMNNQKLDWVLLLYKVALKNECFEEFYRAPIFKCQDKWISYRDEHNEVQLFKNNGDNSPNYNCLDKNYYGEYTEQLEKTLDLSVPNKLDEIKKIITTTKINNENEYKDIFRKVYSYFKECYRIRNITSINDLGAFLSNQIFFLTKPRYSFYLQQKDNFIACFTTIQEERIKCLVKDSFNLKFLDIEKYKDILGNDYSEEVFKLLLESCKIKLANECGFTLISEVNNTSYSYIKLFREKNKSNIDFDRFGLDNNKLVECEPLGIYQYIFSTHDKEEQSKRLFVAISDYLESENEVKKIDDNFFTLSSYGAEFYKDRFPEQHDIPEESILKYMPIILKKNGKWAIPIESNTKYSELSEKYVPIFSNIEDRILRKIFSFLNIEDDRQAFNNKELSSLVKDIGETTAKKILEFFKQENCSVEEFLYRNNNYQKQNSILSELSPVDNGVSITGNNYQTAPKDKRIEGKETAKTQAKEYLNKNGFTDVEESKDTNAFIVRKGEETIHYNYKSASEEVFFSSRDLEEMRNSGDNYTYRLLLRNSKDASLIELSLEDIWKNSENLHIRIEDIKDYSDEKLRKFLEKLKEIEFSSGFSLVIDNPIKNRNRQFEEKFSPIPEQMGTDTLGNL